MKNPFFDFLKIQFLGVDDVDVIYFTGDFREWEGEPVEVLGSISMNYRIGRDGLWKIDEARPTILGVIEKRGNKLCFTVYTDAFDLYSDLKEMMESVEPAL